jgi:MFS family permease
MATSKSETVPLRLTPIQWVICSIAVIGFAFDTYEILMLPLILRDAIRELTGFAPGTPGFQGWARQLFYYPAIAGGIFGLLGGYLTDLLGRRRVLTFSILLYGFSAFASGFATSIEMLLVLRCFVFIGVCVEFVAAVAWLAELFPNPAQRERVLGWTQACSSFGGVLVGGANALCVAYAANFPALNAFSFTADIAEPHAAWRYTLMSGVIPAIPLILIRPFLPESPVWKEKRATGTLRRPSIAQLFTPALRRTTIITTLMMAMSYGAAFGAIQQLPQILPGLAEVRAMAPAVAAAVTPAIQTTQEIGGLAGRLLLALLVVRIASRRTLIRFYQVPGLFIMPFVFAIIATNSLTWLYPGAFVVGLLTVGQFSFWGNYLPRMYPVHLRGTGESFAANIGGRLIGTSFAYLALTLATTTDRAYAATKMALVAAGIGFSVYLIGFIASFWLPEPEKEELPE